MTTTKIECPNVMTTRGLRIFHMHSALVWQGLQNDVEANFAAGYLTQAEYDDLSEVNRKSAVNAFDNAARKGTLLCC